MNERERQTLRARLDDEARLELARREVAERMDRLQDKLEQVTLQRDHWHRLAMRRRQVIERKELYIRQLKAEATRRESASW